MGERKLQKRFVDEIKDRLENWFTASEGEKEPLFYYNRKWGSLIGCRPSYGSDSQLNDHHFHYGYFIRAAAEVARRSLQRGLLEGLLKDYFHRALEFVLRRDMVVEPTLVGTVMNGLTAIHGVTPLTDLRQWRAC